MKKRVLTLLLAALFLLGALGSCSQQTENAADEGVTADAANPSPTAEGTAASGDCSFAAFSVCWEQDERSPASRAAVKSRAVSLFFISDPLF